MSDKSGYYSVIQFSTRPSSFEYVNVGVVVALADSKDIRVRVSGSAHRIRKLFEDQGERDFQLMAATFVKRVEDEFAFNSSLEHLSAFGQSRANLFRLLPFRGLLVRDIDTEVNHLFKELVGEDRPVRRQSAHRKLTEHFRAKGVLDFVDRNPEPVVLPGSAQSIRADYGYQNGHYNLIEAVSFKPKQELNALRRISGDAHLLKEHSDKRLVFVADLPPHSADILDLIRSSLSGADARVYPLADVDPLVEDIRRQRLLPDPLRLIQ